MWLKGLSHTVILAVQVVTLTSEHPVDFLKESTLSTKRIYKKFKFDPSLGSR